jgi:hypothetical protein
VSNTLDAIRRKGSGNSEADEVASAILARSNPGDDYLNDATGNEIATTLRWSPTHKADGERLALNLANVAKRPDFNKTRYVAFLAGTWMPRAARTYGNDRDVKLYATLPVRKVAARLFVDSVLSGDWAPTKKNPALRTHVSRGECKPTAKGRRILSARKNPEFGNAGSTAPWTAAKLRNKIKKYLGLTSEEVKTIKDGYRYVSGFVDLRSKGLPIIYVNIMCDGRMAADRTPEGYVRTASSLKDYTSGTNNWCSWGTVEHVILKVARDPRNAALHPSRLNPKTRSRTLKGGLKITREYTGAASRKPQYVVRDAQGNWKGKSHSRVLAEVLRDSLIPASLR